MAEPRNDFCTLDDRNAPKWSVWNALMWKLPNWHSMFGNDAGQEKLISYKTSWITFNKVRILLGATKNKIPADFLGCVIYNEVGGDPPWIKRNVVLPARQFVPFTRSPQTTSEGAIKIQLEAALEAIGMPPETVLDHAQQNQLTACLETDMYNIDVVARFLRRAILFDYPKIDTRWLSDEQFIICGSRYNRGTERDLKDFVQSLRDPPGSKTRAYTEYGRAMMRHRLQIQTLLV